MAHTERDRGRDWSRLMARAQDGDKAAYLQLLEQITPYLRSYVSRQMPGREDVEDVVQDVLLTVHAIRHTYDPLRPFGPWLVAIAKRRVVDRWRQLVRTSGREVALGPLHETLPASQTNLHEQSSDFRSLDRAMQGLTEGQRQAIELLKLKEMSLKEAALSSGMSVAALKVAGHRAIKALRAALAPKRR